MRFSRLSLERYGRFRDCQLDFRAGVPDLHIIYGPNEAGKTTSLAAVSDLLFGFPQRSPYNFLFDYTLLRVGAMLEDGGQTLECRRKKGTNKTLLNAHDTAIDEAPLLAMLKGQTREMFGLSFSLDQDALRAGGRAMVEARNDLGRALFAAGSGLTGISDELGKLEAEADAIWGPQAAARRSFTQAQRDLADSMKTISEAALKPKKWLDAKTARDQAADALAKRRGERDGVQAELRGVERVRRMAPLVRLRGEQLEQLRSHDGFMDVGKTREDWAEAIILDADIAQRAKTAAEQLLRDVRDRMAKVATDPAVLAEADEIDALVSGSGAGEKAAHDVVRLEADHAAAEKTIQGLRAEAGQNADTAPTRAIAARLRDLAQKHAETTAAKKQIEESRADLEARRQRARAKLDAAGNDGADEALVDAIDAARALGADADARCETARRSAQAAGSALPATLGRLAPWTGTIEDLRGLPKVAATEIEQVREELSVLVAEIRRNQEKAQRAHDEAAAVSLEIEAVGTASAVSPDEIATTQADRTARWLPIRAQVLDGVSLPSPREAVAGFEASIALVDERMERRFALADASSRLSLLERTKASHALANNLATARGADAERRRDGLLDHWAARLATAGLPKLEPVRFQAWQAEREAAEAAQAEFARLAAEADTIAARRDAMRAALSIALGTSDPADAPALSPVLTIAERKRRESEAAAQQRRLAQAELEQVESDTAALDRRAQRIGAAAVANAVAWAATLGEAGLDLDVMTCSAVLDAIQELREATASQAQLRRRIDGISRDAQDHTTRVNVLADRLRIPPADTAIRLRALRERLTEARSASKVLESLELEEHRRSGDENEADAKLCAADQALAPLLGQTGSLDRAALALAVERSRAKRSLAEALAETEGLIVAGGDGFALDDLVAAVTGADPDELARRVSSLNSKLTGLNTEVDEAAAAHGDARRTFSDLENGATSAADAAADAEQARAELEVLAEHYILKRTQAVTLKWAIEQYRERHQDPLLLRASELFSILTVGRYAALRVDNEGATPRLLGMRDDGRTLVEVQHMSEGTTDQLFLALRLAAMEQSVTSGVNLPFLADDLFVNFDDERAQAGFRVLAEVARSTQVLFFTHHPHLVAIARSVVGADLHSQCTLT
jgi:uncharacterized protein YhaN